MNQDIKDYQPYSSESFDLIISRAVLEHVYYISASLANLNLLLKKNGHMLHEIDFRDHGIFTRYGLSPFLFTKINQRIWNNMSSNIGAPNRKPFSFFLNYFLSGNYNVTSYKVRTFFADKKILERIKIEENFSSQKKTYDNMKKNDNLLEDHKIGAAFIIAQKN